ncbi:MULTISPECIES: NrtR DNA-binding winged helix domain-containing protein [Microbacterium]|uniref:NUDIX hydrolase n=1 Tax=Microbacterium TaxID=33882 RepID=UPI0028659743|nr:MULTISPECIES: NUDIX domain-containing protein [Microbacterium]MDR7111672.1 ADP-ribose pyrophosphatase YjhB (NUDIX family) [Microbacterium trichothecenolyticum]MDT0142212.1 NUDIX domain-containing protein [Microbacterium sp. PRC9]
MTRTASEPLSPGAATESDATRVAVSTVIFTLRRLPGSDAVQVVLPLVRRTRDPHEGQWALPGGWLDVTEGLDAAASRTLAETTGLAPSYLEQLYAFGAVDRSPTRVVSIVYWALLRADEITDTVENVQWFDAAELPRLAFDHNEIVDYALWRLRNKVGYSRIAHGLLADEFTLADLREVYEAVLGRRLDPANFRRQVENSGTLIPTDRFRTGSHRPARLYRYNQDVELADRGPLDARH